jgi:hypothetical protein
MVDTLSLSPPSEDQTIPLDNPQPSPLSSDQIATRTQKYDFAAADNSPGPDVIYNQLITGQEDQFRQRLANIQNAAAEQQRAQLLSRFAQVKQGQPATQFDSDFVDSLSNAQLANPDTNVEQLYASRILKTLYGTDNPQDVNELARAHNHLQAEAAREDQNVQQALNDTAQDTIAKRQIIQKAIEDAGTEQENGSFLDRTRNISGSVASAIIPFVSWYQTHNIIRPPYPAPALQGDNTAEQRTYLWSLPVDQFYQKVQEAADQLGYNPVIKQQFLQEMLQYGASDKYLSDAFNVADIASFIGPGALKAIKAGRAVKSAMAAKAALANLPELSDEAVPALAKAAAPSEYPSAEELNNILKGKPLTGDTLESTVDFMDRRNIPHEQIAEELGISVNDVENALKNKFTFMEPEGNPELPGQLPNVPANAVVTGSGSDDFWETPLAKQLYQHIGPPKPADMPITSIPENAVVTGPSANEQLATALKGTVRSVDPAKPDVQEIAAAAGRDDLASASGFYQHWTNVFNQADPSGKLDELVKSLPEFMDPGKYFRGASKLTRELTGNLIDMSELTQGEIFKALSSRLGINTTSNEALLKAYQVSDQLVRDSFDRAGVSDALIGYDRVMPEQTGAVNTGYNVYRFGRPGGKLFEDPEAAENWAKAANLPDARVLSSGNKYIVQVARPIDLSADEVKDAMLTADTQTPRNWLTTMLQSANRFRTPANRLSKFQQGVRNMAVEQYSELSKRIQQAAAPIQDLSPASHQKLSRFLAITNRKQYKLPDGTRIKGVSFNSQGEFETAWQDIFKADPTPEESLAYFNSQQLNYYDYVAKNLSIYQGKVRQGIRSWTMKDIDGSSVNFEGKELQKLPWDNREGVFKLYDPENDLQPVKTYAIRRFASNEKVREKLNDLVENQGFKVIQSADPQHAPGTYILTKNASSENLGMTQIPFKGGGHVIYDYDHYIKQPRIVKSDDGTTWHTGDNTVLPVTSGAQANEYADALNRARLALKAGDVQGYNAAIKQVPAVNPDSFVEKFKNRTLDINQPFVHVSRGESSVTTKAVRDLYQGDVHNWMNSDLNLLRDLNHEYVGRRGWDISGLQGLSDEENPMFELGTPRLIDPLPTISHAVNRAIRNQFFQNYQMLSAEHFVEEFHDVLADGANLNRLRANPLEALANPKWLNNTQDRALLGAAKSYQDAAIHLVGTSTEWQRWQNWLRGKLLDTVYDKFGAGAADKFYGSFLPVAKTLDPIRLTRNVAFHSKLGLFNPVQLFLQAQTFTNTLALSPRYAMKGVGGGGLMRLLMAAGDKPELIDHFAGLAKGFGWKSSDFKEAYEAMKDSGILNIGPQHVFRSDSLDPDIFAHKTLGRWLDKGLFFFNEGERFNHVAAFGTAYAEWKAANPVGTLDRFALTDMMRRYSDLSGNMTHANSSALNRGFGAVAGQFFTYQERLAELLMGRRLTAMQKMRAFGVYSLMYGVPVAAAGYTTFPFYDDVRAQLLNRGIQNNHLVEAMSEGLPEMMLHAATGTQWNLGSRFGPNGIQTWQDLLNSDKSILGIASGAGNSIMGSILQSTMPLAKDIQSIISGDPNVGATVTANDLLFALSNVSTISNGMRAYYAINAHTAVTKGLIQIDNNVNTLEGLIMGITGMEPNRINDVYVMQQALKDRTAAQAFARQQAQRYLRMYWTENDPQVAKQYKTQARAWLQMGGLNFDEQTNTVQQAISEARPESETQIESFLKKYPNAQRTK